MKFRVESAELYKKMSFVLPAVPAMGKAEKAWSEGFLIEATETNGGMITITTTDIRQIGMKTSIKAKVERPGKALFRSVFYSLADGLQRDGEMSVDYQEDTQIANITTQSYRGKWACVDCNDFRVLGLDEDDANAKKFTMPMSALEKIADTVAPSADPKDVETGKSGVLIRCEQKMDTDIPEATVEELIGGKRVPVTYPPIKAGPSRLVAVAADGKKLSKLEVPGLFDDADPVHFTVDPSAVRPFEKVPNFEMMIPAGLLQTSYRSLSMLTQQQDILSVSVFGGFMTVRCGQSAVALRLLSAKLPNWRRSLVQKTEFSFVVGVNDIKAAANIASISNQGRKDEPIIMEVKGETMSMGNSLVLAEDRSVREVRTVQHTTGNVPTESYLKGFRFDYFSHVLNYIKTDYVWIDFSETQRPMLCYPCVVVPGKEQEKPRYLPDTNFVGLIMPVRVGS